MPLLHVQCLIVDLWLFPHRCKIAFDLIPVRGEKKNHAFDKMEF